MTSIVFEIWLKCIAKDGEKYKGNGNLSHLNVLTLNVILNNIRQLKLYSRTHLNKFTSLKHDKKIIKKIEYVL